MISTNILLSRHTTYQIGGPAKYFAEAKNELDIINILNAYNLDVVGAQKIFILGGGANVLFADEGYNGLVLKISIADIALIGDGIIYAGAGAKLQDIILFALEHGLTGLEWAAGIPGSLGGAIRGNAGAFGGEMKDIILRTRSININHPHKIIEREAQKIAFDYRGSIFKSSAKDEIIISSEIKLFPGIIENIEAKIEQNIQYKKEKQPTEPSAGSIFKNIDIACITEEQAQMWKGVIKNDPKPVLPVAFLISEAGLKGTTVGRAMISEKHSNFFINTGGATSNDIKTLIKIAKTTIKNKFQINIEEEIQIVD